MSSRRVVILTLAGALVLPAQALASHKRLAITQENHTRVEVGGRVFMEGVLAVETYGEKPIGSGSPVYCSGGARSELLGNGETKDQHGRTYTGEITKHKVAGFVYGRLELDFAADRLKTRMAGCGKYAALWSRRCL